MKEGFIIRYEDIVHEELDAWRKKIVQPANLFNRLSKNAQRKINSIIPDKAHQVITDSIRNMVQATLAGSNITTKRPERREINLYRQDQLAKEKLDTFRKTAIIEGVGTGAGGILLGLADFPLLLSIEMKFLYEVATVYGFDPEEYDERLFLLHIFQLAFSSDQHKRETLYIVDNWKEEKEHLSDMDWYVFQQEYRDHIDLIKLFQLIPGFGALVGAYANHNILDTLGETAINAYRMRILTE